MADAFTAKLDLYLDGELPASEMQLMDAHLRSCPSCAADLLGRLQFKRAVQAVGKSYAPSAEFKRRIQRQIAAKPRSALSRRWLIPVAVALLIGSVAASYVQRGRVERAHTYTEVADLYVGTLASANPVDVISTDRHTVKPWFEGKLPFTFTLPELQGSEFSLLGGRVAYLGQAPGAELVYQIRKHRIVVLIVPERESEGALPAASGVMKESSFNLQTWSNGGLRYFAISDVSGDDLERLADMFKRAA